MASSYDYVDNTGATKSVQANSAQEAISGAKDIAPNSGVREVTPGTPALIATSSQSRNEYANNVNSMNAATASMATASLTDRYNKENGLVSNPDGSTSRTVTDGIGNVTTTVTDKNGNQTVTKGAPSSSNNDPNKSSGENAVDFYTKQYQDATKSLDDAATNAKSELDRAAATLQSDPAASAAVSEIMAKYDEQIRVMKEKNALVAGNNNRNAARYGNLQYATEMNDNFMSDQQDRAQRRVLDLINEQTVQANKVRQAYADGDIAAFNAAQKSYDAANKSKIDAINDLLQESHKVVKEEQDKVKAIAAQKKEALSDDVKLSANLGKTIVDNLASLGIKDDKKRRQYIEQVAAQYGIDNVDILDNAVVKEEQTSKRQNLLNQSTQKSINKTVAPKKTVVPKGSTYSFTAKDKTNLVGTGLTSSDISNLSKDIASYGIDAVLAQDMNEEAKTYLTKVFKK